MDECCNLIFDFIFFSKYFQHIKKIKKYVLEVFILFSASFQKDFNFNFFLMCSTFNILFSKSLVFLIESVFDLVFFLNQNKKYLDKRTKIKRKKKKD
jgi:hypothetical protein